MIENSLWLAALLLPLGVVALLKGERRRLALRAAMAFLVTLLALHTLGVLAGVPPRWSLNDALGQPSSVWWSLYDQAFGVLGRRTTLAFVLAWLLLQSGARTPARRIAVGVALPVAVELLLTTLPLALLGKELGQLWWPELLQAVSYPLFAGVAGLATAHVVGRAQPKPAL
jgi:hypothetical protein